MNRKTDPAVDPRIWTRRVAVTRAQGRKRLRIVIAVAGVLVRSPGGLVAAAFEPLRCARTWRW